MSLAKSPIYAAHAGLLLRSLIVGLSFPAVALLSADLPLNLVTSLRLLVALLILLPFLPREARALTPSLPGFGMYWLMGFCQAGFFGTLFWAAQRVSAVSMSSLFVCVPLFTFLLSVLLRVERLNFRLLGLLLLGGLGALILVRVEASGNEFRLGHEEFAYLLSCGGLALYPVLSKLGLQRGWLVEDATVRSAWGLLTGSILTACLGLALESPGDLELLTGRDLLLILYLGVFSSSLTFWLSQRAILILVPSEVVAYTYLVPLVSMLLLFVNDPARLGIDWLPGVTLVLLSTAFLLVQSRSRQTNTGRTMPARNLS